MERTLLVVLTLLLVVTTCGAQSSKYADLYGDYEDHKDLRDPKDPTSVYEKLYGKPTIRDRTTSAYELLYGKKNKAQDITKNPKTNANQKNDRNLLIELSSPQCGTFN